MSDQRLSCQEFVELVTDYVEGALAEPDRVTFERHISACPGCDTYLEQMRVTITLAGRLTHNSISPEARDRLLEAFRDWKRSRS